MTRRKVFICYSHRDRKLFDELLTHLDPLEHQDLLEVWTDQEIMAGEGWEPEIYRAIDQTDVAVLLVSPDLLPDVNYFCARIASANLLPKAGRCLTRIVTQPQKRGRPSADGFSWGRHRPS